MFLGLLLTIMSALAIEKFIAYINITKFKKFKKQIFVISFALILLSLLIPTYIQAKEVISNTINQDEVNTLLWLKSNTPKTSTILASVEEGNYITAISERKNVADTDFLLAPDRYKDVTTIFKTESLVIATQLMHKYSVDYLYVSDRALKHYGIDSIKYIGDENCFNEVYSTESTKVYRLTC
ncbi:hypothetical protein D6777_04780 [Candidatus Woesearchaeota archaeon]|nr:MAG: hypothetical protein D6777_04780 [Candidatus Woesearchaeota archaeon]